MTKYDERGASEHPPGTAWEGNRAMVVGALAAQELARAMAFGTVELARVQTETALGLARAMSGMGSSLPAATGHTGDVPDPDELPVERYDDLTVEEISEKLCDLSAEETRKARTYEKAHKNRAVLVERFDRSLV